MSTESKVQLESSDGVVFEVDLSAVGCSQLLMDVIEFSGTEGPIPVTKVSSNILTKVIEYCMYHLEFNKLADDNPGAAEEEIKHRDAEFVQVEHVTLVGLINAANYLSINELLDLMCQRVADIITSKTLDEARRYFGIVNDLTPEAEETIRRENEWVLK